MPSLARVIGSRHVQRDLIGHEKERRGDERLRAAAHAQWLAQQDEDEVKRLMDSMRNGFKKSKRPSALLDVVCADSHFPCDPDKHTSTVRCQC